MPLNVLDRCIECVKIIERANVGRTLRNKEEYARIIVFLVAQERGVLPPPAFRGKMSLKRLELVSRLLHDTLRQVRPDKDQMLFSSCKAVLEKVMPRQEAIEQRLQATIDRLNPFLSSKSTVLGIAIVAYVIWQSKEPTPSFKATSRSLGVPPSSLRTALRSLAKSLDIAWTGTSTRFDTALLAENTDKQDEGRSRSLDGLADRADS